jgi:hypothetical protein
MSVLEQVVHMFCFFLSFFQLVIEMLTFELFKSMEEEDQHVTYTYSVYHILFNIVNRVNF